MGKGKKKMLENGASIELLRKGKNHSDNITYRYSNMLEEKKETEEGGPQAKYNMLEVLGTYVKEGCGLDFLLTSPPTAETLPLSG